MIKKILLIGCFLCFGILMLADIGNAQSLPVGTPMLEDYYRRMQLLGQLDSNYSFSLRPVFPQYLTKTADVFDPDSSLRRDHFTKTGPVNFTKGKGFFEILPLTWQQQYNSDHPYGWNDGPMIPAKGYQTMVSGGFFAKFYFLSIQLRPEYVYAANQNFNGYASGHNDADLSSYYQFHNLVEWPEQFGNGPYKKASWGQSSIRLTFNPISIGLSNENVWWGPGVQNSLILTNNAPGFKHITINTVRPIKTWIGSFEGQVLAGRLENVNIPPLLTTTLSNGASVYNVKRNDWRYFTGFNINYHPKWVPGLFLGLTRTFNAYYNDVKKDGLRSYLPFFTPYQKQDINAGIGDSFPRDQLTSIYARWLFTKAHAEVYFEFGREDNSYNYRDFILSPQHSSAYNFGLRKMITVNEAKKQYILVGSEITQTSQGTGKSIRQTALWYVNYQLLQGHTNEGQTLGAGTGTGGNIQSVDLSWVSGFKKIGLQVSRFEHDVDFSDLYLPDVNNNNRKWVDFAFALNGEWNYKNLLFNVKLQPITSLNYEWILKDYDASNYYIPHNTVNNLHGELGITYRF